jgi:hypothetical protein
VAADQFGVFAHQYQVIAAEREANVSEHSQSAVVIEHFRAELVPCRLRAPQF